MTEERRALLRMDRLVDVRRTFVTAAEAAVREAESMLRYFEDSAAENARQIQQQREENAHLEQASQELLVARERFILSLQVRAKVIAQDLEKARQLLEKRRAAWRETMKDKKSMESLKARRLQEWTRSVDSAEQKRIDEMTIGKHVRDQSDSTTEPAGRPSPGDAPLR